MIFALFGTHQEIFDFHFIIYLVDYDWIFDTIVFSFSSVVVDFQFTASEANIGFIDTHTFIQHKYTRIINMHCTLYNNY